MSSRLKTSLAFHCLLSLAILGACEQPPTVGGRAFVVKSPVAGRVTIEGTTKFVDPETPVIFDQVSGSNPDITFVSDRSRVTLLSVTNEQVDFTNFVSEGTAVRGSLVPISIRPDPSQGAQVTVISDGQKFVEDTEGEPHVFDVPRGHEAVAIAVWRLDGETRWTVRDLGLPAELDGHQTVLKPKVTAQSESIVHLEASPSGWMRAELVYEGVRTGLIIGEGRVGPSTGTVVQTTGMEDESLSLWLEVVSEELGPTQTFGSIGASIPMDRPSVALSWLDEPTFSPAPQDMEEAAPIGRSPFAWSVESSSGNTELFDVQLEALGLCRDVKWRVVGPMSGETELPELDTEDVFGAPLIRADIRAFESQGQNWATIVGQAMSDSSMPLYTGLARIRSTVGYWRQQRNCDNHPYQGLYAAYPLDNPDCRVDGTTDVYLIDRCGALIRVIEGSRELKELCGEIRERLFTPVQGMDRGLEDMANGVLRLGSGFTAVDLVPINPSGETVEQDWLGHWFRYEITEQDFLTGADGLEVAQNDPVRIAVGGMDGGPWLYVGPDGRGRSRARFARFGFSIDGEMFNRTLRVDASGCQDKPRFMSAFLEDGSVVFQERVFGDRPDEFRLRSYRFQR